MAKLSFLRTPDGGRPDFRRQLSPKMRFRLDLLALALVTLGSWKLVEILVWFFKHISVGLNP